MPFDYTGSFSGSFTGDLTSTNGVISSSAQVSYTQIRNKPTTISAFQANSIIANTNFRQGVFTTYSSSVSDRLDVAKQTLGLVGTTLSISNGNSVSLANLGAGAGGTTIWSTGSQDPETYTYLESSNNLQLTGSFRVSGGITGSLFGTATTASYISDTFISASVVRSGFGSTLQISGSTLEGVNVSGQFRNIVFDSSTGLHVSASDPTTAFVSIGSHFRDIIVNGQTTLVATGSDQLEIIGGNGISIFTSLSDTNANSVSKELEFRLDTASAHFINAVNELAGAGGIFTPTGSIFSTTNNLQVTGSLKLTNVLKVGDLSQTSLPAVEAGMIAYSGSNFYFGIG